jgi:hypothetical protein
VAVYQKTLKLLYVDELLARVAREFAQVQHSCMGLSLCFIGYDAYPRDSIDCII